MKKTLKNGAQLIAIPRSKEQELQHKERIKEAQQQIKPCGKTFKELEEFIIEQYKAKPIDLSEQRIYSLKMMIVMNRVLEQPVFRTVEDMEAFDHEKRRKKARQMIDEGFDLDYLVYQLNVTNEAGLPIEVAIERNYEYINLPNGDRAFWHKLMVEYGVFEEDIRTANHRFVGYLMARGYLN